MAELPPDKDTASETTTAMHLKKKVPCRWSAAEAASDVLIFVR